MRSHFLFVAVFQQVEAQSEFLSSLSHICWCRLVLHGNQLFPQHFLYFLPLPQGHGSLRRILAEALFVSLEISVSSSHDPGRSSGATLVFIVDEVESAAVELWVFLNSS